MSAARPRPLRAVRRFFLAVLVILALIFGPYAWVNATALPHIASTDTVAPAPTVLVLGAGLFGGEPSPFLAARLDLAVTLLNEGTAERVIVSGDGRESNYDEPAAMRTYLMEHGISSDVIVEDPAGLDTFQSCVRAKEVYGASKLIIATQDYHLPRAVAACRMVGLDASGVGDLTARSYAETWFQGALREVPADAKLVWDLLVYRFSR